MPTLNLKNYFKKPYFEGDSWLWRAYGILVLLSFIITYSSSSALAFRSYDGNPIGLLFKHLFIVVIGFSVAFMSHKWKLEK